MIEIIKMIMGWQRETEAPHEPRGKDSEGDTFPFESDLRDYLASNLDIIESGLELFVDKCSHKSGIEYSTPIGRIDILAVDATGAPVVIELKRGRGSDAACGQILRYTAWVKRHLFRSGTVRGFIIAHRANEKLRYAASDIPHVSVQEYRLKKIKEDLQVTLHSVRPPVNPLVALLFGPTPELPGRLREFSLDKIDDEIDSMIQSKFS